MIMIYRLILFSILLVLAGCRVGSSKPYNELDTFLSGDATYVYQLQNQLALDPNNQELKEKLDGALRDARNRRDKEKNNDARYRKLEERINSKNLNNNPPNYYGYPRLY
ncbi:MAG: hypothetical protein LBJ96_05650 [Holosporaceae bacterium]|jgi:hypothetical protein|nr:hypothetical protein [Holosporaceae bacterium]